MQWTDEVKMKASDIKNLKMQADSGYNFFMIRIVSVAFAMYCGMVMSTNWSASVQVSECNEL